MLNAVQMRRATCLAALVISNLFIAACTMNAVRPLPSGASFTRTGSIIVFGVGAESHRDLEGFEGFGIELDEYDVKSQSTAGNCFRFNRAEASIAATPGPTQYFAFVVPSGHYAYAPFNTTHLDEPDEAFAAPEGEVVYIGDFIYTKQRVVVLRRDVQTLAITVARQFPELKRQLRLADTVSVKAPKAFLCAP